MVVAMAEGGVDFDELQSQKCMIQKSLEREMKAGDTWYLVDPMWMRQWRRHVGYDESESQHLGQAFPGSIDNSALLKDDESGELRDQMMDGSDYELLPEDGWTLLVDWYGLADQQTPISRKVVEHGLYVKQTKVEVYLLPLKLCQHSELDKHVTKKFSKEDTIGHLERVMRETFGVSATHSVRVWSRYTTNTYELMSNRDATISSLGLYTGQIVVLEVQNTDGSWPRPTPSCSGTVNSLGDGPASSSSMTTRYGAAAAAGSDSSSNGGAYRPGLCGLANLGNTCFMNSVLQCLSNTPPLCQYFTSGRHLAQLNTDNPLGMRGEIAKAFGSLVQEMWSGRYQSTMPRAFKYQVSRFAPQFSGYQQHDSQEMLTFILDALNEDLNRVRKKPYIELKDADGRPDAVVAAEAWSNYLKRNDSIVSDLFFGLLKSTVVCPECPKVSVTFDPFCTLQLPLPVKRDRTVEVCVVFADPTRRPVSYRVTVSKQGQVRDLSAALQKLCRVPQERLVLTELYQRRFHTVFTGHELLKTVSDKDVIYAYERATLQEGHSQMAVYNRCSETGAVETTPFFVTLRRGQSSYAELRAAVDRCMSRYTRLLPAAQWREPAAANDNNGVLDSDDDEECEEAVAAGEDCGMDTQPSPSEPDVVTEEEATPYRLVLVNAGGTSVLRRRLHEESGQLQLPAGCALQLVWQPRAFSACVDLQEERSREQHQSVQQTQQHNSRQHRPVIQLSECLDLFTTTEKLGKDDAWYCPDCKKHQEATKKFDLWSLPDVLIVHLKRFSYTRIFRDKIDLHVEFPTRQLDMRSHLINPRPANSAIYDLIGVSNHYGGLGGGHYVAMCRSRNSGEWYNFDDSSVTLSSEESVCTKAAYVLFYMRRGTSSSGPTAESSASSPANGDSDMESASH